MLAVLRLGHRIERDKRLTSHVALVARAFGADEMYYTGDKDPVVEQTVKKVVEKWGGTFQIHYISSWRELIKDWKGKTVHLTMYGLSIRDTIQTIRSIFLEGIPLLVIVGSEKVDAEVYSLADYNVSITNQPHSEAAALAVFLDRLYEGAELDKEFPGALYKVVPTPKGKKVLRRRDAIQT